MRIITSIATITLLAASTLTACAPATRSLTIFAASSLAGTFETIGKNFEQETGHTVTFNFGGSSGLVEQMRNGAPADVFASADEVTMNSAVSMVLTPKPFATNTLTIAVPKGNPDGITGLESLADPHLSVAVCASQVPCGNATHNILRHAHISFVPISEESKVTDVLTKVENGQADAGLVYTTDVQKSDSVDAVDFPEASEEVNTYMIGITTTDKKSKNKDAAKQFVEFVRADSSRKILTDAGFGTA